MKLKKGKIMHYGGTVSDALEYYSVKNIIIFRQKPAVIFKQSKKKNIALLKIARYCLITGK